MVRRTAAFAALLLIPLAGPLVGAGESETEVAGVLDTLHEAASKAQSERYFGLFTAEAVFFGTDPKERWSIEQFRAYAEPYFARGQGWTYQVVSRNVFIAPGDGVAWFDEELWNENYGYTRGTGVLVEVEDGWKIAQYNLSIPIPNDLATRVVEMIRE